MANQNSNPGSQGAKPSGSEGGKQRGTGGSSERSSRERGFAAMDPKQQREIASEGGRAAHEKGTAHEFTSEEARQAGRKGGEATAKNRAQAGKGEEKRGTRLGSATGSSGTPGNQPGPGRRDH